MHVTFRTDAGTTVGTGHLMRCLALAEGLRTAGAECLFLCRDGIGALAQKIAEGGHRLHVLPEADERLRASDGKRLAHDLWLPGGWQQDLDACLDALAAEPVTDWLVVDHYALDRRWETGMRAVARHVMAIDDLADRDHDCDLLVDQNLMPAMASRYDGLLAPRCRPLLGPRYALLRREFSCPDETPRAARGAAPRLLVMFGGADAADLTIRTVQALAHIGWQGPVDVVAGPLYPALASLRSAIKALPAAELHAPAGDVAALMRAADLAVGSPGVASWERCACALPSLTIAQAMNQEKVGEVLAEAGGHWYLGRADDVSDDELEDALRVLGINFFVRQAMSAVAISICDGQGVKRVTRQMLVTALTVREARAGDAALLFGWRNDERTRRQSLDPRPLDPIGHVDWLMKVLRDDNSDLLLISRAGREVACVRFDRVRERATVSIYIDPDMHGQGIGGAALTAAIDWLGMTRPEVQSIDADVLSGNEASGALFRAAGFTPVLARYELKIAGAPPSPVRIQSRQALT